MTPATKGERSMNLYMNKVSAEMIKKERAQILDAAQEDIRHSPRWQKQYWQQTSCASLVEKRK